MHSFGVHSNESACRKKVRLGLEQVIYGIVSNFYRNVCQNILHTRTSRNRKRKWRESIDQLHPQKKTLGNVAIEKILDTKKSKNMG